MNNLSQTEIHRMVCWLLELEPSALWLHEVQPMFWAIGEKGKADPIAHSNEYVSQDRLLGVCYRAAHARQWLIQLNNPRHCLENTTKVRCKIFYDAVQKSTSEMFPYLETGFAVADALIKAHGVKDWRSKNPG